MHVVKYKYKIEKYNDVIGFTDELKNNIEFKLKYIERSRNKGFRCDQAKIEEIHKIINNITNNTFEVDKKISRMESCCILEIILRHYNRIKKNNKIWYMSLELACLNKIKDAYRKNKKIELK